MAMIQELTSAVNQLKQDIVVDEEAFAQASAEFAELAQKINSLADDINQMMTDLRKGFDTPAGRKFCQTCYSSLITPIIEQKIVVEHISENLTTVRQMYQSVFDEYRSVVNEMNS